MTRDNIFEQDRNERQMYNDAAIDEEVELPLTKDGFEALLERAAGYYTLPVDDLMRQVLAGYIHHVPNEQNTAVLEQIAKVLHKSVSNSTTWRIDQEIKQKFRDEADKKAKELKDSQLLPINSEPQH